jgi:hypothetical protein
MVQYSKNKDLYSIWYNISNEIGKQLFDISNIGNLNYDTIQDSWKGYSEKVTEQFSKYLGVDENYYKNMTTLWTEFTDSMSNQMSNLNVPNKSGYYPWYESWLEYSDKFSKDFTEAIQSQIKQTSDLYEMNDLWFSKFGFPEKQKEDLLEVSHIMSDYWVDMMNKTTEIFKESLNPENNFNMPYKLPEFYQYWTQSYSNLIERLMNTPGFESFKGFSYDQNITGLRAIQKFFADNMKNFGMVDESYRKDYDKIYDRLHDLKSEVDRLTKELDKYNKPSRSKKK